MILLSLAKSNPTSVLLHHRKGHVGDRQRPNSPWDDKLDNGGNSHL